MDAPTREQKTIDALIARGVAEAPAGGDCPAPDVLAAFQERTLETDEWERWLNHIADCRRCQALLAAIGRAETDAGAEHAAPGSAAFPWWGSRVLAPLAAFSIVVLAVWVTDPWPTPDQPVAREGRQAAIPTQEEQASAATELAEAKRAMPTTAPAVVVAEPTAARVTRSAEAPVREVAPVPRANAAAPSPLAPPAAPASAPAPTTTGDAVGQPESLAASQRSTLARDTAARLERARFDDIAAPDALLIVAPDPATRWRVTPGGAVERSDNGGDTWRFQIRPGERVTAGSAPSDRVAWLVGENGLVLRTTDGESWERTTAPVTTDLNDVDALDGLVATVSTADGRRFQTVDGGARWAPLP